MSLSFQIDGKTVWDPALRVGRAFVGNAEALGDVQGVSPGLSAPGGDPVIIDATQNKVFIEALAKVLTASHPHGIHVRLVEPVHALCVVMLERAGVAVSQDGGPRTAELLEEFRSAMPM